MAKFFLDDIFEDTAQYEVVLYSTGLDMYFILKLAGLSYSYVADDNSIELLQWRFVSDRLHLEFKEHTYVFTLTRTDEELGMVVVVSKVVDKKIVGKEKGFLSIIDTFDSVAVEQYAEVQERLEEQQAEGAIQQIVRRLKKVAAPIAFTVACLFVVVFF